MPESLQQKVDRMTAGMEVTVTFGGPHPGTVSGATWSWTTGGKILGIGTDTVRFGDGSFPADITAIDMPDPEPPWPLGAVVRHYTGTIEAPITDWSYQDRFDAWVLTVKGGYVDQPEFWTLVPPEPAPFKPGDKVRWNATARAHNDDRENRKTVARCEKVGGYWRVYYVRDADERYDRWDFADGLELAPEPAEPDCPAILVTYTGGRQEAKALSVGDGGVRYYGSVVLRRWLESSQVATVQALRPAEYLRGGR